MTRKKLCLYLKEILKIYKVYYTKRCKIFLKSYNNE